MVVFVLTLLIVAGSFAFFQWGGNVLLRQATPEGHFEAAKAGGSPDYSKLDAWISHPDVFIRTRKAFTVRGVPHDPSRWLPPKEVPPDLVPYPRANIFYVHPTTYLERDRWNAPPNPNSDTESRTRLFVQTQATAFSALGPIWAPRYRQAAYGAFLLRSEDAQKALDLAYQDVAAAFEQFTKETGNEPVILAGHSQGALHVERLLREKVAGKPIARRIIAAYVIGWPISTTADLPTLGLPACRSPEQARCILSWMTFGEPANPDLILRPWEKTKGFNGGERRQEDMLCVNPITGIQNGAAQSGVGGIIVPSPDLRSPTVSYNAILAHCDKGLLILDGSIPPLG
ncbi:MAG: DUF3089 domain-containing protein, partial [Sphingomicrobium sp.]